MLRQVFTLSVFFFFFNITLGKCFLTHRYLKNPLDLKPFLENCYLHSKDNGQNEKAAILKNIFKFCHLVSSTENDVVMNVLLNCSLMHLKYLRLAQLVCLFVCLFNPSFCSRITSFLLSTCPTKHLLPYLVKK